MSTGFGSFGAFGMLSPVAKLTNDLVNGLADVLYPALIVRLAEELGFEWVGPIPMITLLSLLVFWLAFGLVYGNGNVWLRYALGIRAASQQGLAPRRPARFLDWCLLHGVMRMSGTSIQFRHRQLQDWLMASAAKDSVTPQEKPTIPESATDHQKTSPAP